MPVAVGERFSEVIHMTPEDAAAFARAAHDPNPLHHDPDVAARSHYGKLTVSGTQTASRLMALIATYFSEKHDVVGVDFSVRFHKAVFADESSVKTLEQLKDLTPKQRQLMNRMWTEIKSR